MKTITCHTGGASGADMLFETLCAQEGFNIISYSFEHHNTKSTHRKILTEKELQDVNPIVTEVGKIIKRNPPFKRPVILKFLQRDIYQAMFSQVIFAIGTLNWEKNAPNGGTAWAVGMGIRLNLPIFFFDQADSTWYRHSQQIGWNPIDESLIVRTHFDENPKHNFTGIGTRTLTESGTQAINKVITWYKNLKEN